MTDREARLRRLKIRSWRRGIKEMDLILGTFWDAEGDALSDDTLAVYEAMLSENDQDLYLWCSGQAAPPPQFESLITQIMSKAKTVATDRQ